MQKTAVFALSINEVWWKGQGGTRSGDYMVCYPAGESAE
jgi:hypothetical protein